MAICLKCGKDQEDNLCKECRNSLGPQELEKFCRELISYDIKDGSCDLYNRVIEELNSPWDFRDIVYDICGYLPEPRREYMLIMGNCRGYETVTKAYRGEFYQLFDKIRDHSGLTDSERTRLMGIALGAYYMDYEYAKAETVAMELCSRDNKPWQACAILIDFYLKTRRYKKAGQYLEEAEKAFTDNEQAVKRFKELRKYIKKIEDGGREYMPAPNVDRKIIQDRYKEFIQQFECEVIRRIIEPPAIKIPKSQEPSLKVLRKPDFDSFVAYDFETTGLSGDFDEIIDVGAIKVINGKIVESEEFTFSELVKPYKKSISSKITGISGITPAMVKDARRMWDVIPDFMDFVGGSDMVLVGFNNVNFDSKFLLRAGRYSGLKITNPQFDVMDYACTFKNALGITGKKKNLNLFADTLGIVNPCAHRAMPDAVTTAKVFLKLREMALGKVKS